MNFPYLQFQKFNELERLINDGLVTKRKHPDFDLWIYNYSPKAQFLPRSEWTETLSRARGLVLDESGRQVARSFDKFWNYDAEFKPPPGELCYVSPKLDGSMILTFQYEGKLIFATRGSFQSEQSKEAEKIFHEKYSLWPETGETFVFEVIYPENRIVVDYGEIRKLSLLTIFDGDHEHRPTTVRLISQDEILIVPNFSKPDINAFVESAKVIKGEANEGWVVRYWPSNLRIKIKGEDYVRLHRLIHNTSEKSIWEMLKNGEDVTQIIQSTNHNQFSEWIREKVLTIQTSHDRLAELVSDNWETRPKDVSRKEFAAWTTKSPSLAPFMFAILDGKDIGPMLWDFCHPKFPSIWTKVSND